jgi:hypothetical protein
MRNYAYFTDHDKTVWDRHNINKPRYFEHYGNKNIGLEFKTDTRFSYCNTNYAMLALIIEKITISYKMQCTKLFFMGMKNLYVFDYDRIKILLLPHKGNKVEIGKTTWMQFMAIKIFILRQIY